MVVVVILKYDIYLVIVILVKLTALVINLLLVFYYELKFFPLDYTAIPKTSGRGCCVQWLVLFLKKRGGARIQGSGGGQWSVLLLAAVRGAESRLQPTLWPQLQLQPPHCSSCGDTTLFTHSPVSAAPLDRWPFVSIPAPLCQIKQDPNKIWLY